MGLKRWPEETVSQPGVAALRLRFCSTLERGLTPTPNTISSLRDWAGRFSSGLFHRKIQLSVATPSLKASSTSILLCQQFFSGLLRRDLEDNTTSLEA